MLGQAARGKGNADRSGDTPSTAKDSLGTAWMGESTAKDQQSGAKQRKAEKCQGVATRRVVMKCLATEKRGEAATSSGKQGDAVETRSGAVKS